MYKCQITNKFSRRGDPRIGEFAEIDPKNGEGSHGSEKLNKIVVATREVQYKHWDREAEEEWFSYGTEIVKEINASDSGLLIWEGLTPDERAEFVKGLK